MITLVIDASTYVGDVAVVKDERMLAEERVAMRDPTHERLMPAVASVISRATLTVRGLDRIICGAGPGSFTSLRIAGSIAKGIATGTGAPLVAVPSLALLVAGAKTPEGRYLAALDALRGEFYVALYDVDAAGDVVQLEPPRLVPSDAVESLATENAARIVGPAPIGEGSIVASPRAAGVLRLRTMLAAAKPVDLRSWEPSYGRLAEAQVKWEAAHGRPLSA
jgi:tRNA threonylcarbamoyladenosine biosynthesis protein TsaB